MIAQARAVARPTKLGLTIQVIVVMLLVGAGSAAAETVVLNSMAASMGVGGPGIQAYEYGSGIRHLFDDASDWGTGTLSGSGTAVGEAIEIGAATGNQWWDATWQRRQCFNVSAASSLGQYPVRVEVDTTGLAADDIRVVRQENPATSATPLPHYVEPDVGTAATAVWFQTPIGGPQTFCVYFDTGGSAGSTSDEFAPFTYTNGQTVGYYTMTDAYNGAGVNGRVQVVSYVDGNVVSDGSTIVTLNTGDLHTFSGLDENGVITATGPIDASYNRQNRESLLPAGFADDVFAFPTNRSPQLFWIRSPHQSATVEAIVNGAVVASINVGPADGSVQLSADAGNGDFVTLRSTDGTDFLATHATSNDADIFHGVPWFGDALIGVASQNLHVGSTVTQGVDYQASNGATATLNATSGGLVSLGGNGPRGNGRAYRLEAAGRFHAIQQADANGLESTSFLPERLLSQTYRIPVDHNYVAVACPVPTTSVVIGGVVFNCDTGAAIGHAYRGLGLAPEGTLIEADHPVFVYYETRSGSDEHNVYGAKGAVPHLDGVAVAPGPVETQSNTACATWLSPEFRTADVFGRTGIDADGTYTFRISFDRGPFLGPDGTDTTSFDSATVIPFGADGATLARIEVEFCGGDGDQLRSVWFESQLVEVVNGLPVVTVDAAGVTAPVPALRVYPAGSATTSWIELSSAAGADSYSMITSVNGVHIEAVGGTLGNPGPPFASEPYSVLFDGVSPQSSQLAVNLVELSGVRQEVLIDFVVQG